MAHIIDDPAPVPVDVPTGWACPRCQHVYSPLTAECFRCSPPSAFTAAFLPRPEEGFRVGPILPVPVDEPPPGAGGAGPRRWEYPVGGPGCPGCTPAPLPAETCCSCASPKVVYHNYRDQPFCAPCADGERPRGIHPVLHLPAHMAEEGNYCVAHLGAGFTEIFPGLEAAVFWPADDDGKLVAHFRLTPEGGPDCD